MTTGAKIGWLVVIYALFRGNFLGRIAGATAAAGTPGGSTLISVPSNLLSSDFGGTAAPTAANDPIGLAIGARSTPGGFFDTPLGPPVGAASPAPGDVAQANTDAANAAATTAANTNTGAMILPLDESGDMTTLPYQLAAQGLVGV